MGKKFLQAAKDQTKNHGLRKAIVLGAVIGLLALLNLFSVLAYINVKKTRASPVASPSTHPLLDPARQFYEKGDLIINFQPLREKLNKIGEDPRISIYFEYLSSGANITVNKDADFYPASLLKVPVTMAAVKKIEKGEWKWENELVLLGSDKDNRFGELYKNPIGTTFTIRELINQMLIESDDTAYNIVLRNLEPDELGDIHKHLGLEGFLTTNEKISAKQYAVILRSLYNAAYLSEEDSNEMLQIMVNAKYRDYLGSAIPGDVQFAHKIGTSGQRLVFLDAGIAYVPRRPYLLVAMMETKDEEEAKNLMQTISKDAYDYVVGYAR